MEIHCIGDISCGVKFSDGSMQLEELARGYFTTIRSDDGPTSQSITLVGYATVKNADPKTVVLSNPLYRSFDGSKATVPLSAGQFPGAGGYGEDQWGGVHGRVDHLYDWDSI